ncbi:MAG: hypothetical protein AAB382_07620, partial [Chloroflexota bacterium]
EQPVSVPAADDDAGAECVADYPGANAGADDDTVDAVVRRAWSVMRMASFASRSFVSLFAPHQYMAKML